MADLPDYREKRAFFDRVVTVYGRKPALEALTDSGLECHALHLADSNRQGGIIDRLEALAATRGIPVKRHSRTELARISRNGRQDQGVALDIVCPAFRPVADHLGSLAGTPPLRMLALDGITNPQNLGMIIRSAVAGDIDGIIWSRRGNAALGPLVIKASAGTLYRAPLLLCTDLPHALEDYRRSGAEVCVLSAAASTTLFTHRPAGHCIYVLGNETEGVSAAVQQIADRRLAIPMAREVDSLNVAVTAGLVAYAARFAYLDR